MLSGNFTGKLLMYLYKLYLCAALLTVENGKVITKISGGYCFFIASSTASCTPEKYIYKGINVQI